MAIAGCSRFSPGGKGGGGGGVTGHKLIERVVVSAWLYICVCAL